MDYPSTRAAFALRTLALGCALLASACTTTDTVRYGGVRSVPAAYQTVVPPLSVSEILAGLQGGRSQATLLAELRERGLRAPVTEDDVDLLLKNGAERELVEAVRAASASAASDPTAIAAAAGAGVVYYPPVTIVHDFGWYPWTPYGWYPWVPFSLGLSWHYGSHRHYPPSWHQRNRPVVVPPSVRPPPPSVDRPSRPQWQAPEGLRPSPGSRPGRMLPGGTRQIKPAMPRGGINVPVKPSR